METNGLYAAMILAMTLAGSAQAPAYASPPKKSVGVVAPRAATTTIAPPARKEPKANAVPARAPVVPVGVNKILGGGGLPDLIPVAYFPAPAIVGLPAGFPGVQYCDPNPAGGAPDKVRYRVFNQGATSAPPFNLRFDFVGAGSVNVAVNGLSAGNEKSGAVSIPPGCYPPGFSTACQFTVTVDSNGQIGEGNEANNSAQSLCVGPAG
jgi:CARDB